MNALERFKKFFKEEGVVIDEWSYDSLQLNTYKSDVILTAGQAHFHFKDGEYLGVESDEMGHFDKKL